MRVAFVLCDPHLFRKSCEMGDVCESSKENETGFDVSSAGLGYVRVVVFVPVIVTCAFAVCECGCGTGVDFRKCGSEAV